MLRRAIWAAAGIAIVLAARYAVRQAIRPPSAPPVPPPAYQADRAEAMTCEDECLYLSNTHALRPGTTIEQCIATLCDETR